MPQSFERRFPKCLSFPHWQVPTVNEEYVAWSRWFYLCALAYQDRGCQDRVGWVDVGIVHRVVIIKVCNGPDLEEHPVLSNQLASLEEPYVNTASAGCYAFKNQGRKSRGLVESTTWDCNWTKIRPIEKPKRDG